MAMAMSCPAPLHLQFRPQNFLPPAEPSCAHASPGNRPHLDGTRASSFAEHTSPHRPCQSNSMPVSVMRFWGQLLASHRRGVATSGAVPESRMPDGHPPTTPHFLAPART
ncbi:hypothetical protein BKA80DRAFT_284316 [Phyllosticta citrichinensis]